MHLADLLGVIDLTQGSFFSCMAHFLVQSIKAEGDLGFIMKTAHREYYIEASSAQQRAWWQEALLSVISVSITNFEIGYGC